MDSSSPGFGAPTEVAYAGINLARARDLKADVPLLSTEDGGPMGLISLTLKAAASIRPFLDVRRAFMRMDADGDGAVSTDELQRVSCTIHSLTRSFCSVQSEISSCD